MAMQRSEELGDVAEILFKQVQELGIHAWSTGFNVWQEGDDSYIDWATNPSGGFMEPYTVDLTSHPFFREISDAKKRGEDFHVFEISGEPLAETYALLASFAPKQFEEVLASGFQFPTHQINHYVFGAQVGLMFITPEPCPEAHDIFKRFGKVFEQTYTRFLDLQKAEAQAREAKIEAALEKVRSRTMAMHHSSELSEAASLLFNQLNQLGAELWSCGFAICEKENVMVEKWMSSPNSGQLLDSQFIPYTADHGEKRMYDTWNNGIDLDTFVLEGDELQKIYEHFMTIPSAKENIQKVIESGISLPVWQKNHVATFKYGYLLFITTQPFEDSQVFIRFAKVFEQTYTRFLDLQKAEAQAREAQIEASMERVRSRTMAMHKSEELGDVSVLLYRELTSLGVSDFFICGYVEVDEENNMQRTWMTRPDGTSLGVSNIPLTGDPVLNERYSNWKKRVEVFQQCVPEDQLTKHVQFCSPSFKNDEADNIVRSFPVPCVFYCSNFQYGYLHIITGSELPKESESLLARFTRVFEMTYKRFLDLQKAEAQAREAQIELALERVRARTMAMQRSEELTDTAALLFQQVNELGIHQWGNSFQLWDDDMNAVTAWTCTEGVRLPIFKIPTTEDPVMINIVNAARKREDLYVEPMGGEALQNHYNYMFSLPTLKEVFFGKLADAGFTPPTFQIFHAAYFSYGYILFITHEPYPEAHDIFKRFAKVFEQTYTRFLDLQKAEAQAKEAKIEAALEKVRSRTMAMQRSEELPDAALLLFKQLQILGVPLFTCSFNIWDDDKKASTCWGAREDGLAPPFKTSSKEDVFVHIYEAAQRGESLFVREQDGEELEVHYRYLISIPEVKSIADELLKAGLSWPTFQIIHCAFFSQGYLLFISYKPVPEAYDIFKRFAKVFEQTYTRFLDLQKAEAQAREAQIQLAMERVRARTMAMQRSDELAEAASILFKQVYDLGINSYSTGFNIWEADDISATAWMSKPDGEIQIPVRIPYTEDPFFKQIYEARQSGNDFFVMESGGEELAETYRYMFNLLGLKEMFNEYEDSGFPTPTFQITHCVFFPHGYLIFITLEAYPEAWDIFKRFGKVFEQTYTRFLDLQKAEAQAREATIESALEKVRGRAMAMHKSDELLEAGELLYRELSKLGIPSLTAGYVLMDEEEKIGWNYTASPADGKIAPLPVGIPHTETSVMKSVAASWKKQEPYYFIELDAQETIAHQTYIAEHSINFPYTAAELISFSPGKIVLHSFNFKQGYLLIVGSAKLTADQEEMMLRFTKVFEMTYRRFLDLQKAEAQAREAQIEAALERVRSRTLAMQKSDELQDASLLLFQQVQALGIPPFACGFNIWDDDKKEATAWMGSVQGLQPAFKTSSAKDIYLPIYEAAQRGESLFVKEQAGKELEIHYQYLATIPVFRDIIMVNWAKAGVSFPTFQIIHCAFFSQGYLMFITYEPVPEAYDIFKRFAKVFEQTYTRFLDLQKAEAQAREAQIEAALERVRSRTMAMQKSVELHDAARLLFQQIQSLGVPPWSCGFNIWEPGDKIFTSYMGGSEGTILAAFKIPLTEEEAFIHFQESRDRGDKLFVDVLEGDAIKKHYEYFTSLPGIKEIFEARAQAGFPLPTFQINHLANFSHGNLMFITYEPCPQAHDIFIRFAKVFEQTYTRFLDLQKAEAQAREAKIETGLEKVRSRTMAMQNSEELQDTAFLLFQQIQALDVSIFGCGFNIWDDDRKAATAWMAREDGIAPPFKTSSAEDVFFHIHEAAQRGESLFVREQGGEELETHYRYMATIPLFKEEAEKMAQAGISFPTFQIMHCAFFSQGYLMFISYEPVLEAHDIFKRFAKVFEQTYTRFLDLQKAEAQAKEAQIEAALERVRSRSMAMQNSDELAELVATVFKELNRLEFALTSCIIWINNPESLTAEMWVASTEMNKPPEPYYIKPFRHPYFKSVLNAWKEKNKKWVYEMKGEEKKIFQQTFFNEVGSFPSIIKKALEAPESVVYSASFYNFGALEIVATEKVTDKKFEILHRLGKVFDMSYTRFNDLKQAEAQAMEAIKRASVDRVRAEIASMRTISDLERITPLIWNELTTLGVPFIRCGVFIMDEEQQQVQTFLSTPDGKAIAAFRLPYYATEQMTQIVTHWQQKKIFKDYMDEAAFIEYTKNLVQQGAVTTGEKYLTENRPTNLYLHFLPFLQGMVYVGNTATLSDDALQLVQNLADAFSTAYARYEDFNKLESANIKIEKTLVDLKQAQAQLVQSEKMASLGELTAGIAHEIQNPLNFVNNFSEVNTELIEEMKEEIEKGNLDDAKAIANDIKDNEQKINHHGKRADAIVKGMLQHSRSSTGAKEPTDINALADEYLRLAYHGLRAKDKSFNATMKTDFDESIGNINIIPQDIGRVILNLITNAFYVVDEKKKQQPDGYEPTVWVSTKKINGKVEIKVKDNGNGIPQKVLDKIFQPFFTTKPTGLGTGLGLSLSYDIVKAHGGELKVETKEGEGSDFIILLPIV
jgi:signal transduction histidine kinase